MQIVCNVLLLFGFNVVFATEPKKQDVYLEIKALNDIMEKQATEIKQLKMEMEQCRNRVDTIEKENKEQKRGVIPANAAHVAFYAHLSRNIGNLGLHQTIIFDTIRFNNGNSYNSIDGEFIAPIPGTYFFIWTMSNGDRTACISELVVNGVVFNRIISDAYDHIDWAVATGFTIAQLSTGDRVWIRSGETPLGEVSGVGFGTSSFAGFLIWE